MLLWQFLRIMYLQRDNGGGVYRTPRAGTRMIRRTACGGSTNHGGVDPQGVDFPVSIYECLRVLVDDWYDVPVSVPPNTAT